ncbi:thiamine biosynthesis protein ThiS [Pseudopedobacter saltans DSM 12145]|uniref:Thiamine biosynthesis protein ThiS n=1 Tax=Pseudopedobacter saltans (strain ATCC 51119 / DSM 12145 / JCM 21818 / CCUG 39354 / LMG 10337 / NBRC 100064 / NCIMB 13643) TaxID=762903 RepID=F0SER2_PSESL|nr:sulfur carrier protein ThiS [Pseudopedobacter saltans]ADY51952.1 thiamine biosynthesis protein ThiS [Pseudopedobacter saltans DSM 12145]
MKIKINHQFHEVPEQITILQLMQTLFPQQQSFGMAVAVNQDIIDKSSWANHQIQENDSLTLIKATQGG